MPPWRLFSPTPVFNAYNFCGIFYSVFKKWDFKEKQEAETTREWSEETNDKTMASKRGTPAATTTRASSTTRQASTPHSEDHSNSHKSEIPPWWDHKEHSNILKQLELPWQLQWLQGSVRNQELPLLVRVPTSPWHLEAMEPYMAPHKEDAEALWDSSSPMAPGQDPPGSAKCYVAALGSPHQWQLLHRDTAALLKIHTHTYTCTRTLKKNNSLYGNELCCHSCPLCARLGLLGQLKRLGEVSGCSRRLATIPAAWFLALYMFEEVTGVAQKWHISVLFNTYVVLYAGEGAALIHRNCQVSHFSPIYGVLHPPQ